MFNRLVEAQQRFQLELMAKNGVIGVGVGYRQEQEQITDQQAIMVLVERKQPLAAIRSEDLVPGEINGMRTDVIEVGRLEAQNISPRDRWRPVIPAGVSIGHPLVTAGTLGAVVKDRTTGEKLILSNNHVLAHNNAALVGDSILQPAATDRGQNPADAVARLERFERLRFIGDPVTPDPSPDPTPPRTEPGNSGCDIADAIVAIGNTLARLNGSDKRLQAVSSRTQALAEADTPEARIEAQAAVATNQMDVALAKPLNPAMFSEEIMNIGAITGIVSPQVGMRVRKSGRTTGTTTGVINVLNAMVDVSYSTLQGMKQARFTGQCITSGMSQGGDSGSLIVTETQQAAVGLLFAGSGAATIFTPISVVLQAMNLTI